MAGLLDFLGFGQPGGPAVVTQGGQPTGLLGGLSRNSDSLLGFGMGMLGGANQQEGFSGALSGMQRGELLDRARQKQAKDETDLIARKKAISEWAMQNPSAAKYAPMLMANPELADKFAAAQFQDTLDPSKKRLSAAQADYYTAKAREAGAPTVDEGKLATIKTPAGDKSVVWKGGKAFNLDGTPYTGEGAAAPAPTEIDPSKAYGTWGPDGTWNPAKGVPQSNGKETPLPAEVAGRVALAETYLKNAPGIREKIKSGSITGPWDVTRGQLGSGDQGSLYGDIESGVDALQRGLTGAGMGAQEAANYARRYLPTKMDTAETMLHKHDKLVNELQTIRLKQYEGRKNGVEPIPQGGGDLSLPAPGQSIQHPSGATITRRP